MTTTAASTWQGHYGSRDQQVFAEYWDAEPDPHKPLLVAVHGGGSDGGYFQAEGHSLPGRAAKNGFATLVIDRPNHGRSAELAPPSFAANARALNAAIAEAWRDHGEGRPGIVLVGHSIGGAIVVHLAASRPSWPLLGVSIFGTGITPPSHVGDRWSDDVLDQGVDVPFELRVQLVYGPPSTVGDDLEQTKRAGWGPTVGQELIEIYGAWLADFPELAPRVEVPVQLALAEHDSLWQTSTEDVERMRLTFSAAPFVEARYYLDTGHSVDLHILGESWQLQQLAFARQASLRMAIDRESNGQGLATG